MTNKLFPGLKSILMISVAAVVVTSASVIAQTQPQARITQALDDGAVMKVPFSTHPMARAANDRGRLNADAWMDRMVLVLRPSDAQQTSLKKLIDSQHDKASANYRRWLTPDEYGAQYGVSDADLKTIVSWLTGKGFQVGTVARGRQWIEFSGTAGQVERTFHTEMHNYKVNGEARVANAKDISLPRALAPAVAGILSLHNFPKQGNHGQKIHVHRDNATGKLIPDFTLHNFNGTFHFLVPGDYKKIYNTQPLLDAGIDGTGVSIAIVGRTDIFLSDVQMFRKTFGLPANDPVFLVNGADPGLNDDVFESDLDVQWAGAVAPNAEIKFVTSASTLTTDGVDLSLSYVIDNAVAPIMSTSYSACEAFMGTAGNAHITSLFQQAAAEGITALISSGDNGPAGCDRSGFNPIPAELGANVSGLATTPYTTTVGGTQFNERGKDSTYWLTDNRADLSSVLGYIPEIPWNESCDLSVDPNFCFGTNSFISLAGGGGPSNCSLSTRTDDVITCLAGTAKPSWQAGLGVPNDGVRDIPDLSMAAAANHDAYLVCDLGSCITDDAGHLLFADVVGGTSAATPAMAGIMALVEQKNGAYQGMANYSLYQLAAAEKLDHCNSRKLTDPTQSSDCVFYDITSGNNSVPGQAGYSAGKGYDMATGLGSVNAANLANTWASAQKLASLTTVDAGATSIEHGQTLPLNVVVTPAAGGGAPSGDFSLVTDRYGAVMGGTLKNGTFAGGVTELPGGTYQFKARYGGDAMFAGSDSTDLAVKVMPEDSVLQPSVFYEFPGGSPLPLDHPIPYGWSIGVQLDVHGKSNVGSPSGKVTLMSDNIAKGAFPLNEKGSALVIATREADLPPGKHVITVTYNGDHSFKPSAPVQIPVTIRKGTINFGMWSQEETVTEGAPYLLRVWGRDFPTHATGTINLYDNGRKIAGPTELSLNGEQGTGFPQAIYTLQLKPGFHVFTLSYTGDSNYEAVGRTRGFASVTVNRRTTAVPKIRIQKSPGTVKVGESARYVVTVEPATPGGPTPTGEVGLLMDIGISTGFVENVAPQPLIGGRATFDVPWYFAGIYFAIPEYSGDANYSPWDGAANRILVQAANPTVTLTTPAAVVIADTSTSVSVKVAGQPSNPNLPLPTGDVQLFDSINGGPERRLGGLQQLVNGNGNFMVAAMRVTLPAGTHVIRVQYLGSNPGYYEDWSAASSLPIVVKAE